MFKQISRCGLSSVACCAILLVASTRTAKAATLCVNPAGSAGCYARIQAAVNHASANDVVNIAPGTYHEDVTIGIPLSLIGSGPDQTIIDAAGRANGIFVDGVDHSGLRDVTIARLTVKNAQFEGVLIVSAAAITLRDSNVIDNDKFGPVFSPIPSGCAGQPSFETDENGDCGGGIHLIGTVDSVISGNLTTGNADGILITDETAESKGNVLIRNIVKDNALECGIVLASHPPVGSSGPYYKPHFGVDNNTIAENVSSDNGVKVGGSGVGLFSDGNGPGRVSGNVIINNLLVHNGIGGVALHTHVGPAFGAPADDMGGNLIIGNIIYRNLADTDDTATPGTVGININSGGGGSPVLNTVIANNIITEEDIDIAINTPAPVDIHLNDLEGHKVGVANICAFDHATVCTGTISATQNYWGCAAGPEGNGCTTVSGPAILYVPWLRQPASTTEIAGSAPTATP